MKAETKMIMIVKDIGQKIKEMENKIDLSIRLLILIVSAIAPKYYPMETICVLLALILLNLNPQGGKR